MFAVPCRLIHTPYELNFRVERDHTVLCTKELSGRELKKFRKVRQRKTVADVTLQMLSMYLDLDQCRLC